MKRTKGWHYNLRLFTLEIGLSYNIALKQYIFWFGKRSFPGITWKSRIFELKKYK